MGSDAVTRIKARLTKIALRDTAVVLEQDAAIRRMAELGLTSEDLVAKITEAGDPTPGSTAPYLGFKDRRQAMMAAFAGMAKQHRPAGLGDAADRVNTLIKNQAPERAASTIGLAIISIPAMSTEALPEAAVKRFRRLPSGKLRELGPAGVIDVEADEVVESTVMVKGAK